MQGVAPLKTITSLPVVRNLDNLEGRPFSRKLDSEALIASAMEDHLRAISFKLWTLQDTCRTCGGVVMQQLRNRFPDAEPFSVRYMVDYGAPARVPDPLPPAAERLEPDAGLVTYFDQWRQDAGMS
jgi:rRNA maturation protein Nop10